MADIQKTSVAHIMFGPCSDINFAHVVGEMQRTLTDCMETPYSLEWKQDDVAIFDLETTRIVFAIDSYAAREEMSGHYSGCLMVSVGPGLSGRESVRPGAAHDSLCQLIVRRISGCYDVAEVIWRETDMRMTDVIPLRKTRKISFRAVDEADIDTAGSSLSVAEEDANKAREQLPDYKEMFQSVANTVPDLPRTDLVRLNAIRAALYASDDEAETLQQASPHTRLAATAMDVTLVIVCLPVGAAMLTYHVLKGGELRRSAQMMTVTGLFLSAAQTATAQQLISFL